MEARRRAGAALAVALSLSCAVPTGAAHAAQLVRSYAEGEPVPEELVLDGQAFELASWRVSGGNAAETRTIERTERKTVQAADYGGEPRAHFDRDMEVSEDGYSGKIRLVDASAEVSRSHPEREDYEERVDFSYITKEELDALPETRMARAAGRDLILSKLDVDADRVPSDPGTEIYTGSATYGIHEQREVADEYSLTATYAGEITREAAPASVMAVYEPIGERAETGPMAESPGYEQGADHGDQVSAAQPEAEADPSDSAWALAAVPAAAAAMACAALIAVCVRLGKAAGCAEPPGNPEEAAELVEDGGEGDAAEEGDARDE